MAPFLAAVVAGILLVGIVIPIPAIDALSYHHHHHHHPSYTVSPGDAVSYLGAVVEYEPYTTWGEGQGDDIIKENTKVITKYAATAHAMGVDILVFPEYGLQGLDMHELHPTEMLTFTQNVPAPEDNVVACSATDDLGRAEIIRTLSCTALENRIYLVVDVAEAVPCISRKCPASGNHLYNTQVVFDRSGAIIARYRKKNLYLEWQFTPGNETDETAIFTTDFGVTFTLQVCFDIAFYHPGLSNIENYGIRDVAMSTAWVDVMPFFIAPSVQNGWSRGNGVNLLVAGYHYPERSKMGSGIYRGASDLYHEYVYDTESGSRMILAEVETIASVLGTLPIRRPLTAPYSHSQGSSVPFSSAPRRDHLLIHDDLTLYNKTVLKMDSPGEQHYELCHEDGLCCYLTYSNTPEPDTTSEGTYMFLTYSGVVEQGYGTYRIYAQICAVVWCQSADHTTCGRLEDGLPLPDTFPAFNINGTFSVKHVYPAMFTRHLHILDNDHYTYTCSDDDKCLVSTTTTTDELMTAGLYGRWYDRDP